jgi:transposase
MRWVERYEEENSIKRHNREPIAYKVSKENVKYIIEQLKKKTITINDLLAKLKEKFPNLDLSKMHVHRIIKDNNITLKFTRIQHKPILNILKSKL